MNRRRRQTSRLADADARREACLAGSITTWPLAVPWTSGAATHYQCAAANRSTASVCAARWRDRAAALPRDDSTQLKLDKLDAGLSPTSTSKQDAALFACCRLPKATSARTNGPMVERASQFLWTRQLHPAAFSVRHIPAAFSIDAKGPTMAR